MKFPFYKISSLSVDKTKLPEGSNAAPPPFKTPARPTTYAHSCPDHDARPAPPPSLPGPGRPALLHAGVLRHDGDGGVQRLHVRAGRQLVHQVHRQQPHPHPGHLRRRRGVRQHQHADQLQEHLHQVQVRRALGGVHG